MDVQDFSFKRAVKYGEGGWGSQAWIIHIFFPTFLTQSTYHSSRTGGMPPVPV